MKKILLIGIGFLLLLVGCNKKNVNLDLEKVYNQLSNLKYEDKIMFENKKVDEDTLFDKYNFSVENCEEYLISISSEKGNPNMYFIVKPKEGKTDIVKSDVEDFFKQYDFSWGLNGGLVYFPEAVKLVENRMEEEYGKYLIYIISNDNQLVYNTIKGNNK